MTQRRVILLEASGPESTAIAETAVARGHHVYTVTQPDRWARYTEQLRGLLSGHLLTDLSSPGNALASILSFARHVRADAILTMNEYLTPLNAMLCAKLGIPGNDHHTAMSARNKAAMIERLARCGVPAPKTLVANNHCGFRKGLAQLGIACPLVVKPADAAGSSGVTMVTDPADLTAAVPYAKDRQSMYGAPLDPRILIQEYVSGEEFSVESITQNGVTTHLCLTRKQVTSGPHRIELGHSLPADAEPHTEAVLNTAQRAIAAVGITNGASHTELILSDDGRCIVIEVAARMGAGYIGFLIQHALGIDPWSACLDVALGESAKLTRDRNLFATVRFLTSPSAGILTAVNSLPSMSAEVPIVHMKTAIGSRVDVAADNTGRLGCFAVLGHDPVSVELRAQELLEKIDIRVDPDSPSVRDSGRR